MKLTDGERFILRLLADIGEQLKVVTGNTGEFDYTFIKAALESGYPWALNWKFHIDGDNWKWPPIVDEVLDIFDMWEVIEYSYSRLKPVEKKVIQVGEAALGMSGQFTGFDSSTEREHLDLANFIVNRMERCDKFRGRNFDNRVPGSVDRYRLMLPVFKEILDAVKVKQPMPPYILTPEQISDVLNARRPGEGLKLVPKLS